MKSVQKSWYVSSNFSDPKDPLLVQRGITKGNVCGIDVKPLASFGIESADGCSMGIVALASSAVGTQR